MEHVQEYITYLRSPFSECLSIAEYNARFNKMLDSNESFERLYKTAWERGRQANNYDPSEFLTCKFPSLSDEASNDVVTFQFDNFTKEVPLNEENVDKLRSFADGNIDVKICGMLVEDLVRSRWDLQEMLSAMDEGHTGPHVVDNRV